MALTMHGPWVVGALANHLWSVAGTSQALVQPFLNYNLPHGWYLVSAPILTSNWEVAPSETWTVPVGGGSGKVWRLGPLPVNTGLQLYYSVVRPDGPDWTLRAQIQFLFPR